MGDSNIYSKNDLLNIYCDKIDDQSLLNINNSLNIRENKLNDSILFTDNNEFFDKFFESKNFLKSLDEEKEKEIICEGLENENNSLYSSNKIDSNDLNKTNEEEIKRQLKLKRNREIAKEGRLRKKEYIQNLVNEFNILKSKYKNLLNIMHDCPKCKKYVYFFKEETQNNNDKIYESNNILNGGQRVTNKRKFLFITAITIISIINIFNIPLNIINYYKTIENNKIDYLRNLNDNYNYRNYSLSDSQNLLLNKLNSSNGDTEALYIHFAEYYFLIKEAEKMIDEINQKHELKNEINKNIQIFKDTEINSNQITQEFANNCVKCVVEINKKSIKMGGNELTFYLADRYLSNYFENNIEEGKFPKFNSNKKKIFSKIFAVKCKILAYSINDLFSEKIENL